MTASDSPVPATATKSGAEVDVTGRRIFGLALPALGVLAAEPLYLLFDIAVVGRLGALPLAGLAVGGLILSLVSTQLTFLSYGTTARAARLHGAGRDREAVGEGVQATWLALVIGLLLVAVVQAIAGPLTSAVAGGSDIADAAESWLRIAVLGVPLILVALAGNGWMRGLQNTIRPLRFVLVGLGISAVLCPILVHGLWGAPRLELEGSAVANLVGQSISGILFAWALFREPVSVRPRVSIMRAQMVMGRDLILRSLAFQACFVSAAAVASRFGAAVVGAHQVVLQLWNLVALLLDSLAIAAQTLIGAALGGGFAVAAKKMAWRITVWSTVFAVLLAVLFAAGHSVIPQLFTADDEVLAQMSIAWWFFVAIMPVAGVVFALDGVLLGAGDVTFMRNATMACAVVGFLPAIWMSLAFDWGLAGIWAGLTVFVVLRMIAVSWRALSGKWAVTGTETTAHAVERSSEEAEGSWQQS
ncbi:MATE family efflux transporter [Rhodococcus sp. ACPA4]|uniref:MATE family efflux transporter n=1 Tax=Rhodococcus TaxID=1827 RepID=UPI0009B8FB00|nr:MATE family efflux transporter [Nocardia globerula]PBC40592.1 MATE family efflux transporter [Rhodococcus sp. ACPA4]ROZ46256.1 MATE family efflux transporter [Rhodococcus sp. WS3]